MVSYQTFTALAYEVAKQKGVTFDGIADGGDFQQQIATYWQANKHNLKPMTEAQARKKLQEIVEA